MVTGMRTARSSPVTEKKVSLVSRARDLSSSRPRLARFVHTQARTSTTGRVNINMDPQVRKRWKKYMPIIAEKEEQGDTSRSLSLFSSSPFDSPSPYDFEEENSPHFSLPHTASLIIITRRDRTYSGWRKTFSPAGTNSPTLLEVRWGMDYLV